MSTTPPKTKQTPEQFFYEHAGYGYDPLTETPEQGRQRGATVLAQAERTSRDAGDSYEWQIDTNSSSADWLSANRDGGKNRKPWQVWGCIRRSAGGEILASLWSIDFGRDGEPWNSPYRRVVEAELAVE